MSASFQNGDSLAGESWTNVTGNRVSPAVSTCPIAPTSTTSPTLTGTRGPHPHLLRIPCDLEFGGRIARILVDMANGLEVEGRIEATRAIQTGTDIAGGSAGLDDAADMTVTTALTSSSDAHGRGGASDLA